MSASGQSFDRLRTVSGVEPWPVASGQWGKRSGRWLVLHTQAASPGSAIVRARHGEAGGGWSAERRVR